MLENYIDYITYVRQYSEATIYNYKRSLKKLDQYLIKINKSVNDPENIKLVDMYNFMEDMSKNWLSARTCAWYIRGVVGYFKYCKYVLELEVLDVKKIHTPKIPERKIWYFSEEEKKALLKVVNSWLGYKEETRIRNRLLVYLFLHTWLRCRELAKIKVFDIVGENLQVVGKWWSRRFVYLRKELLDMIYLYLGKRKKDSDYLFAWYKQDHITTDQIKHIIEKIGKLAGVHAYPHKFRHTFATDLLHVPESNIYTVAKLLGHKRISTTQIYLGTNNIELKKIQFWLKFM